ncbi:copper ion binding protein, partial [Peribacillus simplex]
MEKMTLNVKGMSCGHCINSIEGNVGELSGVTTVKVNLDSGTVSVVFNPNEVSIDKI